MQSRLGRKEQEQCLKIGLGNWEAYKLGFQFSSGGVGLITALGPGSAIQPGVLSATTGDVSGQGIYATGVPGVIEFAVDRAVLFPDGSTNGQLWLSAQIGDNNDRVSDDFVEAVWAMGLDLQVLCPAAPAVQGDEATFPLSWSIPASSALGPTDVILSVQVPAGTTFVSASNGGQEAGGTITWQLGDRAPGDSGQVTFTLRINTTSLTINSQISSAEGLSYQASNVCPVVQPSDTPTPTPTGTATSTPTSTGTSTPTGTPTPTSTPRPGAPGQPSPAPSTPPVVPEPATITLGLAGLGSLAGYVAWQRRQRKRS